MVVDPVREEFEMNGSPLHGERKLQSLKKPSWLRVRAPSSPDFTKTASLIRAHNLPTVCEEAACPNIGECWSQKRATIMVMGKRCTRSCAFCHVDTKPPLPLDPKEADNVSSIVKKMQLSHVVITSVDRDDLRDGGAKHFAKIIQTLRRKNNHVTIEILTPDFRNKMGAVETICASPPDIFNHNIETVPRLYPDVRRGARYFHSLKILEQVKSNTQNVYTKSGLMLGLGEEEKEIYQVMDDMREAGIDFLTMGQYLQPTKKQVPVKRYVTPELFKKYEKIAYMKGFLQVDSGPLVRSSYHADKGFDSLQKRRVKKTEEIVNA